MKLTSLHLALAALLALPAAATGCGRTACIEWTAAEGACPAQSEALAYFSDPLCPNDILSVESDGDYAEGLCCYTVTKADDSSGDFVEPACVRGGNEVGAGGAGGFVGDGGAGAIGGGTPMCAPCGVVISEPQATPCPGAQALLDAFNACACSGACAAVCGDNVCAKTGSASEACLSCLQDTEAGCGDEFAACANDI